MNKIAYLSSQDEGYVRSLDNKQGNPGMGPKLCEKTQELPLTELTLQVTCSNLFQPLSVGRPTETLQPS